MTVARGKPPLSMLLRVEPRLSTRARAEPVEHDLLERKPCRVGAGAPALGLSGEEPAALAPSAGSADEGAEPYESGSPASGIVAATSVPPSAGLAEALTNVAKQDAVRRPTRIPSMFRACGSPPSRRPRRRAAAGPPCLPSSCHRRARRAPRGYTPRSRPRGRAPDGARRQPPRPRLPRGRRAPPAARRLIRSRSATRWSARPWRHRRRPSTSPGARDGPASRPRRSRGGHPPPSASIGPAGAARSPSVACSRRPAP